MNNYLINEKNILVSVIIAVYNSYDYLRKCVDSVLKQTYGCFEVILIDDGSTDKSSKICDELANEFSQVRTFHCMNNGVSTARNIGINTANGEYITFLDSDDEFFENALEVLIIDALKYDADVVSAVKCNIDKDGNYVDIYSDGNLRVYRDKEPIILSLEYDRQTNSTCAKLFKKSFLDGVRFIDGRNINEDGFFIFQCYVKCPVLVQHNICIYKYFTRYDSSSHREFSESFFDILFFCEEKKKIIHSYYPDLSSYLITMEVSTHLFFLEVLCRTNEKKYKKYELNSIYLVKKYYSSFRSKNLHEKIISRIVKYNLYPLYKRLIRIRFGY